MSASHTPGPWFWDGYSLGPMTRNPALHSVHTILTVEHFTWGFVGAPFDVVSSEGEANKRLIGAAPDLLQAARAACDVFSRQNWRPESKDPEAVTLRLLIAAIAKAEGSHGHL